MRSDILKKAERLLAARRFPEAIKVLEPFSIDYRESFRFFYLLATACLYVGDIGGAELYYKKARALKMTDPELLNAQALLFLRRGEINKAIEYYLEVQEYDSSNRIAKRALDFIKKNSTNESLVNYVRTGKIGCLYPPLKMRPLWRYILCSPIVLLIAFGAFFAFKFFHVPKEHRADLAPLVLSTAEKENPLVQDTAASAFRLMLTKKEVEKAYEDAQLYFQNYRDNAAQTEINRILNSNASAAIIEKARLLMGYLTEPTFDSAIDEYTYAQVQAQPWLYADCWVMWTGRVTNAVQSETEYRCDLLVGYDTMEKIEGIVPLILEQPVHIDTTLPIRVLAKIHDENGRFILQGKSVHQLFPGKK